nr:glucose-1-phosphate adenylyltransferase [Pyrinomonadaceae bacterium]
DHLYRMDYRDFLKRHYETGADVTISAIPCDRAAAEGFGLLKADDAGRIIEFSEKPKGEALEAMRVDTQRLGLSAEEAERRPFLASMGIYVFNYERLEKLLTQETTWVDFGREIIPAAIRCCNVQAHMFNGYWEDIGTISAFYKANLDLTAPLPKFNFYDADAPIYTNARYLPPSKVHNSEIRDSFLSEGCIINGANFSRSIIGLRSRIDQGTRIEDSVLMGADYYQTIEEMGADLEAGMPRIGIGAGTTIRRAIIDKNARIGANVRLVNESGIENLDAVDQSYYIRDRIIIVPKNAMIKDGTIV